MTIGNLSRPSFWLTILAIALLSWNHPALGQNYIDGRAALIGGQQPAGVVIADLNHDGVADLAVSNFMDNTVSIFLGTRKGTFGTKTDYASGDSPAAMVVADFNGDGNSDLAVANENDHTVSILLANGDGTFQPHADYAAGYYPVALVAGDFNGDNKPDLAALNLYDSTVSIYIGNGDGTLQAQSLLTVGSTPTGLASGDFNGDGRLDLLTANIGSGTVSALLSNGDGSFQRIDSNSGILAGSNTIELVAADFSGDGNIDAVASNVSGDQFLVLVGHGDGTFSKGSVIPNAPLVAGNVMEAADVDHDGKTDLVLPGIYVMLGNGDATFQNPVQSPGAGLSSAFVIADLNGDGQLDLVANDNSLNTVDIFLGVGKAKFGTLNVVSLAPKLQSPAGAVAADFNRDGKLDLAVAGNGPTSGEISVELGNGNGTFQKPIVSTLDMSPINNDQILLTGDFNGDGESDLLIVDSYLTGFEIALGTGDGKFMAPVNTPLSFTLLSIDVGDFNGDGKADVAVTTNGAVGSPSVNIFLSNGDGTFRVGSQYAADYYATVLVTDVNNDGKQDLVTTSFGAAVKVFLGKGDGTFGSPISGPVAIYSGSPVSGDFNLDGKPDVSVGTYSGVAFLAGNGDGTFQAPVYSNSTFTFTGRMIAGQFGGTGKLGVVSYGPSNTNAGGEVVMAGNGDGTFQSPVAFAATGFVEGVAVGDFNSDGVTDLGIADQSFNAPNSSIVLLYLSAPAANLSPTHWNFGSVQVGHTSGSKTFTVTNIGNAPLQFISISGSGTDFLLTNSCQSTLKVGKNCGVSVVFQPSAKGTRHGSVLFTDNATGSPQVVNLQGVGK